LIAVADADPVWACPARAALVVHIHGRSAVGTAVKASQPATATGTGRAHLMHMAGARRLAGPACLQVQLG